MKLKRKKPCRQRQLVSDDRHKASVSGQWNILRMGGGGDGLEVPSLPLEVKTATGPVRLAIGSNGEARLLIPLAQGENHFEIEPGPALRIHITTLMHKGRASPFLDLMCLSTELENVFAEVVGVILTRLSAGEHIGEVVTNTIDDFRALLVPQFQRMPERNRIAGLVAELIVLNRMLEISNDAWRTWSGPAGDRHDFRARDTSLEVKASLRSGNNLVTINGLEQLEPPDGGTLHLLHIILEPVEGGLLNIASLGAQALAKASNPSELRELLLAVGCGDVHELEWNRYAFRLEFEQLYSVSSDFPRITPSRFIGGEVPPGICDATYQIDLAFAEDCRLPAAQMDDLLRELLT